MKKAPSESRKWLQKLIDQKRRVAEIYACVIAAESDLKRQQKRLASAEARRQQILQKAFNSIVQANR